MIDSQTLKTQTRYSLKLHDVRKAAAAYELMHSAVALLQMLPIPVLEALRDYVQEEVKDRSGDLEHFPLVLNREDSQGVVNERVWPC